MPGIDHLYTVKVIGKVHEKGGQVLEFYSYYGRLPTPEAANNPLKFKSPRGTLLSQYNFATFYDRGELVRIPNKDLMAKSVPYFVLDGYSFLEYLNRDSTPFREFCNVPEAHTVIRGSLRYKGNPALQVTGAASSSEEDLVKKVNEICIFSSSIEREEILAGRHWIGLFSSKQTTVHGNLLDTLAFSLASATCMSKAVGITYGIATQMLLDGFEPLNQPGVLAPYTKEIYDPLRTQVKAEGIKLVEKVVKKAP
ncbi:hypothetical protein B0H67DRAFT_598856 [Lasiosphaeris hirsuta]|uniref:Saccharopine dehydrogenase-like C-terminal domain-containing protein n=1 Tax=Lasiosphaeris hirsuta TaxID=260670 RepID=A0AA40B161_9PEZI|nr:hypothetical protein B0H67DRAFT_598856 [Lasiosphaeris hirsuta]